MENTKTLIYDGSFNGFLCAVYRAFDENLTISGIQKYPGLQNTLFTERVHVQTDLKEARRVWQGIEKRYYLAAKKIYFAFLSERKEIEMLLYRYIRSLFVTSDKLDTPDIAADLNKVDQLAEAVAREKQQIERTLQFSRDRGQLSTATIDPRANILPLISRHFRSLYLHNAWVIYDRRRKYGLYYHEQSMELLHLSPNEMELLATRGTRKLFGSLQAKEGTVVRQLHKPAPPVNVLEKRAV